MGHSLQVRLFGSLSILREGQLLAPLETQNARSLFSFLVINQGRLYPRDFLAERLWPSELAKTGKKRLSMALWRVRKVVEPDGVESGTCVMVEHGNIGFRAHGSHEIDIERFELGVSGIVEGAGGPLDSDAASDLREALALYRGDLLEDCYDDWCIPYRERFRSLAVMTLDRLMRDSGHRGDWLAAIGFGERLLQLEPLMEHVYRAMMRYHYSMGNRPGALALYRRCERLLRGHMDIEPMPETKWLVDAIRNGITITARSPKPEGALTQVEMSRLANRVDRAMTALQAIHQRLQQLPAEERILRS